MVSSTGIPAIRSEWTNWHLLFASQPEPDLEFTEEDLDESMPPPGAADELAEAIRQKAVALGSAAPAGGRSRLRRHGPGWSHAAG